MPAPARQNPVLANWAYLYDNMTKAELALEVEIAKLGVPYRAQHRIWNYILDFAVLPWKLAIEVDGSSHRRKSQIEKDAQKTEWLAKRGWRTVRIWNDAVYADPAKALADALKDLDLGQTTDTSSRV